MSGCSGGSCSTCSDGDPDRLPPGMLREYDLNQSTSEGILVWIEMSDGIEEASAELIAESKREGDGRVFGVVFGGPELKSYYPEIFGYGVDTLYHVRGLPVYSPEEYAEALAEVVERVNPATVLMGATPRGRELAPRLAAILQTGLTADCTSLSFEGRDVTMTRPALTGNVMADITCDRYPQMATVRRGTFEKPEPSEGTGTAIYWQYTKPVKREILSETKSVETDTDIRDAKVLIALGGGIRDVSLIEIAEKVASEHGGMVCCSRAIVDRGWMPRSRQVGMSGITVKPDIYIAFGISGSVQHRAGMADAKRVVAVNTDPDAPIHRFADLSILCDVGAVLKAMLKNG
ncbi:MAG: electron transfer flavoprotein subunit alpha/FixB family protein [Candidatus Methanomethylophilaceae archaeon]|nr:electron transfer flavoprotein subunit alpha/FixB family protein [Candidatus Methanomethylophilaceae archaeon]